MGGGGGGHGWGMGGGGWGAAARRERVDEGALTRFCIKRDEESVKKRI